MISGNKTVEESRFSVTWTCPGAQDFGLRFGLVDRKREICLRGSMWSHHLNSGTTLHALEISISPMKKYSYSYLQCRTTLIE